MAKTKVGRPRGEHYDAIRARVVMLKSSLNPKTGAQYTFKEIGAILGMSAMGARRYVRDIKGGCSQCLRKLRVGTDATKKTKGKR